MHDVAPGAKYSAGINRKGHAQHFVTEMYTTHIFQQGFFVVTRVTNSLHHKMVHVISYNKMVHVHEAEITSAARDKPFSVHSACNLSGICVAH